MTHLTSPKSLILLPPIARNIICGNIATSYFKPGRLSYVASMDYASPLLQSRPRRQGGLFRRRSFVLFLAVLTAASVSFTVFFAYNSSLENPVSSTLIFQKPSTSILVLNILSHITLYCIAEFTLCMFEIVRWAFACSASGTPAYTFLALSRATNVAGVFCLVLGKGPKPRRAQRDGHRIWGCQR